MKKHSTPKDVPKYILDWIDLNLFYDKESGVIFWKKDGGVTHKHKANDIFFPSFHKRNGRCRVVNVGYGASRISVQYHHVCWYLAHKIWPNHPIDNANRNDIDNRLCNLRKTDDTLNAYNVASKSKYKGVTKRAGCSTYRVRITVNGKRIDLGSGYKSPEQAFEAYKNASKKFHGEFSCVESRAQEI